MTGKVERLTAVATRGWREDQQPYQVKQESMQPCAQPNTGQDAEKAPECGLIDSKDNGQGSLEQQRKCDGGRNSVHACGQRTGLVVVDANQ